MPGRILIYGGSGGIGSATARALHKRGYDLHLVGRERDKLKEIAKELQAGYTVGDVMEEEFFSRVAEKAGDQLDGLVYAVGTIDLRSFQRFSGEDLIQDLRLNSVGAALAVKASLRALKKGDGASSIVLFSSVAALQGFKLHTAVGLSKGAVAGLALSLAAELAPRVRVNAVAPSLTRTPLAERFVSNEKSAEAIAALHPLKRLGEPEDIAEMAAFLISPESSWITGQVISVDGGRSTLRPMG